jgi:hypothetical protein
MSRFHFCHPFVSNLLIYIIICCMSYYGSQLWDFSHYYVEMDQGRIQDFWNGG